MTSLVLSSACEIKESVQLQDGSEVEETSPRRIQSCYSGTFNSG